MTYSLNINWVQKIVILSAICFLSAFANAECTTNRNADIKITKPDNRYTDNNDGTVTDKVTGLMWTQCSLGLSGEECNEGTAGTYTWQVALAMASNSAEHDYNDWRLPNIKEFESLIDEACFNPPINETLFPNTQRVYWTSSPHASNDKYAWDFNFHGGGDFSDDKNDSYYIRFVRDN